MAVVYLTEGTQSVFETLWDEEYKHYEGYRARMLAKRRALIQEGQILILAGEQIWANYSQQKMSDTKKEIQQ